MALSALSCSPQAVGQILALGTSSTEFGPPYVGVPVSALAYGATVCQAYYYYQSERAERDPWILKALIAAILLANTFQETLIVYTMYYYLVLNFGNPCTLAEKVLWTIPTDLALNCPLQMAAGGFLVYRTWKLGRNMLVSGTCALMVLVATAMNLAYSFHLVSLTLVEVFTKFRGLGTASFAAFALSDTFTSVALVYYLYRSRTGFRRFTNCLTSCSVLKIPLNRSDGMITGLIRLTVSTNALKTLLTLGGLLAYVIGTHGFYVTVFTFLMDKMCLNSMLATLNLRDSLSTSQSGSNTKEGINSIPLKWIGGNSVLREYPLRRMEVTVDRVFERPYFSADSPTLPKSPATLIGPPSFGYRNGSDV